MSDEQKEGPIGGESFDERELEAPGAKKRNAGLPLSRLSAPKDAPEIETDPGRTPGSAEGERETIEEDLRIHSERRSHHRSTRERRRSPS